MAAPRRTTPPTMIVLSWGGGLDSTVLALMSFHGELPLLDAIIWANTHREPKEVMKTFAWVTEIVQAKIPVYEVSAGDLGADVLDAARRHGAGEQMTAGHSSQPPFFVKNAPNLDYATADSGGTLWRKCTETYKIIPIRRKIRELLGAARFGPIPEGQWVEQWIGFPIDDQKRTFCSDVRWITNTFPLILPKRMWKRDLRRWLTEHGYPVPPKSSCTFCPYHNNAYWRDMRDNRPDEWAETVTFEAELQQGQLPGVRGIPYLHKSMVPLPMAPIDLPDTGEELFCLACNT